VTVTLRTQQDTQGRFDVARWEQSLGAWLPNDLSSATTFSDAGDATPCSQPVCTAGANALLLSWASGTTTTTVSYRYVPAASGTGFELYRVECVGSSPCQSARVLGDLAAPPQPWNGRDVPPGVIDVDLPAVGSDQAGPRTVTVKVNGVPATDGVDRSSTVTVTAGGTTITTLVPPVYQQPPSFQSPSDCGGPITLIVDASTSISSTDFRTVRQGLRQFVQLLDGTPTQLQIVWFNQTARTLGVDPLTHGDPNISWNKYFDLSDSAQRDALLALIGDSSNPGAMARGSWTNWEDALYRTFYTKANVPHGADPLAPLPETVVLFTDGVPTSDRATHASGGTVAPYPIPTDRAFYNYTYLLDGRSVPAPDISLRGWYRADSLMDSVRGSGTKFIGVGIGAAFGNDRFFRTSSGSRVEPWPYYQGPSSLGSIPNADFLGDLITGVSEPHTGIRQGYNPVSHTPGQPNDGWGDIREADVLSSTSFSNLPTALKQIALVDCGGSLTMQTRAGAAPAQFVASYEMVDEADPNISLGTITTSRVAKAVTGNVTFTPGNTSRLVRVTPSVPTGVVANGWSCRSKGIQLTEGTSTYRRFSANPLDGIVVNLAVDSAVSCTLEVAP
jgi:hypothetical protein